MARPVAFGLVVLSLLAGCLEGPQSSPIQASPSVPVSPTLPSVLAPTPTPPNATPSPPRNASETRPSFCGGGSYGSAAPSCLVLRLGQVPANLTWASLRVRTDSGHPVAYDRGAEPGNGTVSPSPPSRAGPTVASWCVADAWQDEAWCNADPDPGARVLPGAAVLIWWTDEAVVAGQRVELFEAGAPDAFQVSSPLA